MTLSPGRPTRVTPCAMVGVFSPLGKGSNSVRPVRVGCDMPSRKPKLLLELVRSRAWDARRERKGEGWAD